MSKKPNTKQKYWFKRKRYGYGWVPSSWQGWSVIALYVLAVVIISFVIFKDADETELTTTEIALFYGAIIVAVIALLFVTSMKGPRAKWRWGKKPDDNPDEDW